MTEHDIHTCMCQGCKDRRKDCNYLHRRELWEQCMRRSEKSLISDRGPQPPTEMRFDYRRMGPRMPAPGPRAPRHGVVPEPQKRKAKPKMTPDKPQTRPHAVRAPADDEDAQGEPELLRHWYEQLSTVADSILDHAKELSPECAELASAVLDTAQALMHAIDVHHGHHHPEEEPLRDEGKEREESAKAWLDTVNQANMLGADLTILAATYPHDADLAAERDAAHSLIDELLDAPI